MQIILQPQSELCHRVATYLGPEYQPTHLVFDAADYSNSLDVLDEFRDIAFTWTPGKPTENTPLYFREVTRDLSCTAITWFSKKAMSCPDPLFTWVAAHEFRHVYQSRQQWPQESVRHMVSSLRRRPEFIQLPSRLFCPAEIDSELCALRTAKALVGDMELQKCLAANPLPRCPYPAYLALLSEAAE